MRLSRCNTILNGFSLYKGAGSIGVEFIGCNTRRRGSVGFVTVNGSEVDCAFTSLCCWESMSGHIAFRYDTASFGLHRRYVVLCVICISGWMGGTSLSNVVRSDSVKP